MKKLSMLILAVVCLTIVSCRDNKKKQEKTEATIEKIEQVEKELDETNTALKNKANEVENALNELDI